MAIDPYMGSATSLMSCMEYGLGIYGQDINPLAVLIAQAKISSFDIELITNTLEELMSRIKADSSDSINVRHLYTSMYQTENRMSYMQI